MEVSFENFIFAQSIKKNKIKKMQDLFEVFSGSTADASFINHYLGDNGIDTIVRNKTDESLLAGWVDPNGIVGTQIFVTAENYERAEKLVREYLESREE